MNLFWSVYKNLEAELLDLANAIHFNDEQDKVYSIHIADLLVRTTVEIEALSKHLYEINGGDMNPIDSQGDPRSIYFDSDCVQHLDLKWALTKKVVNVVASNFYFEKDENRILKPLKDCNKQGHGRWKKAYQAVKHERVKCLNVGNIGNLIRAMAALYLLNVYNFDDKIAELEAGATNFDTSLGSAVFSVNVYKATMLSIGNHLDDSWIIDDLNKPPYNTKEACVLIDKYTDDAIKDMFKRHIDDSRITEQNAHNSQQLKEFLSAHPEYVQKSLNEICLACGEDMEKKRLGLENDAIVSAEQTEQIRKAGQRFLVSIFSFSNMTSGEPAKRELILNKAMPIYPTMDSSAI